MSVSGALQQVGRKLQMIGRRIELQRGMSNQFRLIEFTLPPLGLIEWHRDYQDRLLVIHPPLEPGLLELRIERGQGLREHPAQDIGGGSHTVVLEQVNQFAQPAVIAAIGYRTLKGTVDAPADRAAPQAFGVSLRVRRKHTLPANRAHFAADRNNRGNAVGTYR